MPSGASSERPALDVVRVEPSGDTLIAGRAPAGSRVELLVDGAVTATATADAGGQFVILPPTLDPGAHDIALQATASGADREPVRSGETVAVSVAVNRVDPPLVTVARAGEPTAILSGPNPVAASSEAGFRIASVERDGQGRLRVAATGRPGATLRLYVDDKPAGEAVASASGAIAFAAVPVQADAARVRVDEVEPATGEVRGRRQVAFAAPLAGAGASAAAGPPAGGRPGTTVSTGPAPPDRPASASNSSGSGRNAPTPPAREAVASSRPVPAARPGEVVTRSAYGSLLRSSPPRRHLSRSARIGAPSRKRPRVVALVVRPGESLWEISQRVFGEGTRYTVIYGANAHQIADPDVIYPGQVFAVPASGRVATTR